MATKNTGKRNSDHLSPTNEVQKRYLWEPSSILTQNRFYLPSHLEPSNSNNQNDVSSNNDKPTKIPPIFLHGSYNHKEISTDIQKLTSGQFTTFYTDNMLRINLSTEDDYRKLAKHYTENNIPFHTYRNPKYRPLSVVIKNVPPSLTEEEIESELKKHGLPILKTKRLYHKDRTPMPVCAVELVANEKAEEIFKINKLEHSIITVESRRPAKHIPQCHRCQRTGHTKNYCTLQPRCVKCAGNHLYTECSKKKAEPPTCANCGGEHPANFKGCIYKQEPTRGRTTRKYNTTTASTPTASAHPLGNTRTIHNRTYADHFKHTATTENPSTSSTTNPLTTILDLIKPYISQIKDFLINTLLPLLLNGP